MSASRIRSKEKRRADKRKRKAAMRTLYESWRDAGQNGKSKRALRNARAAKRSRKHEHIVANCGNIGCKRCNPREPIAINTERMTLLVRG